jgi:hypothetical protein
MVAPYLCECALEIGARRYASVPCLLFFMTAFALSRPSTVLGKCLRKRALLTTSRGVVD